jgi:sporulation protein YlmC with PRC-barrel domain
MKTQMKNKQGHPILTVSEIKNTTVQNAVGDKIGKIENIMMDCGTGEAAYVVLSVDTGFLNMGSKYFAIPWQAFAFDTHQDDIVILNVEKEKLENAPGFEKDDWPTGPQHEFISEMYSYYGYTRNKPAEPTGTVGATTYQTQGDKYANRRDTDQKESDFIK